MLIQNVGQLESTMFTAFTRATSLRRWIARPDCPPFLQECQAVFIKTFGGLKINANPLEDDIPQSAFTPTPRELRSLIPDKSIALRARHHYDDVIFSKASAHVGNSLILFYPKGKLTENPIPGSIKYIVVKKSKQVVYAVCQQLPAPEGIEDPYRFYPHFPAKVYSSRLSAELVLVEPSWVVSHHARWKMDEDRVVVLTLSRVSIVIFNVQFSSTDLWTCYMV